MLNIQKDIVDKCRVVHGLIDVVYANTEDITTLVSRANKIKELKQSIANLMIKFQELATAINREEELEKVYTVIRLFEGDIPKIRAIIDNGTINLPEQAGNTSLENVKKNLALLEKRLENCVDEIRVNLKVLDNVVIREKVPSFSALMGKLHGEEVIDDVQKAEMNENAMTIMEQINESCENVVTNLNNAITLSVGAITYICQYFNHVIREQPNDELESLFQVVNIKKDKVREVLVAD
ncbi:MAG: hypothetical protein MI673_09000 [Thiotrichales bacterium]|nr:hypothetical protein [Thiotrichales bacterium]